MTLQAVTRVPSIPRSPRAQPRVAGIVLLGRDATFSNGVAVPAVPPGFRLERGSCFSPHGRGFRLDWPIDYGYGPAIVPVSRDRQIFLGRHRTLVFDMTLEGTARGGDETLGVMVMGDDAEGISMTLHYWFHGKPKGANGVAVPPRDARHFSLTLPTELRSIRTLEFVGETLHLAAFLREIRLL